MRLIEFEESFKELYSIQVRGVPVYDELRDGVNVAVNGSSDVANTLGSDTGKISVKRIIESMIKLKRFKKSKTLIFTSSVYRRDRGRNLAAEYLMDKYPEAVVFEWPSRNEGFDYAYFNDAQKDRYCPLEWYLIKFKFYMRLHKNEFKRYCDECKEKLKTIFPEDIQHLPENYQKAIEYIRSTMPGSYATTIISQKVFRKLFKSYHNVEYAIDFWGSARENIIPVLSDNPQSVELQHGIITAVHPGYIYPGFVRDLNLDFFNRILLVYGNKTKELFTHNSVFLPDKVEVIGNPRVAKYKKEFEVKNEDRNLILFTSQPFEQDGKGLNYYKTVLPFLEEVARWISLHKGYTLAVKLHPREPERIRELYHNRLPNCEIYGNTSPLYELLVKTYLHITANSTALYEAATFGTPTITIKYDEYDNRELFGDKIIQIDNPEFMGSILSEMQNKNLYKSNLNYLLTITKDSF